MKRYGMFLVVEEDADEQSIRADVDDFSSAWDDVVSKWSHKFGLEIVDHRCGHNHEYTQVGAQRDPDFFDEGMTQEEYDELMEQKAIYHDDRT